MWTCSIADCSRPSVRALGDCVICDKHFCSLHLKEPWHSCSTIPDSDLFDQTMIAEKHEISQLLDKINFDELRSKAQAIRGDIPCKVQSPEDLKNSLDRAMGGMNIHVELEFDDGVMWIARIRRSNVTSPPPALRDHIIQSEVATLIFLEKVDIPTPKIKGFALEGEENSVNVGYILTEKMPGKVLDWSTATTDCKRRVIEQLAVTYIELSRHPFSKMGCLDEPRHPQVGAFARECLTDFAGSEMRYLGPFTNAQDYYTECIELLLSMINGKEIYPNNTLEAYLVYKFLLEKVPKIYAESSGGPPMFYLKHADDKGTHILIDDDSNITAFIDWEWAFTAVPTLAFNSPMVLLPVSDFFQGLNSIGSDEELLAEFLGQRGAKDLADIVKNGRLHHQIEFCCIYDRLIDFQDILGLFQGIRENIKEDHQFNWIEWKEVALERYKQDHRLLEILATV